MKSVLPPEYKFCGNGAGFTLLEMIVVIAISGMILLLAASFALPIIQASHRIDTEEKLKIVAKALSEYAVRNNRLPCPGLADPASSIAAYGYEWGSGPDGDINPANCGNGSNRHWEGIIPFASLGLTESVAKDGWGRYFTYAISPILGVNPNTLSSSTTLVHAQCRTREWFTPISTDPSTGTVEISPKNIAKAYFCCGYHTDYPSADNLQIVDGSGTLISTLRVPASADAPLVNAVGTIYNMAANTTVPDDAVATLPAFVLASHGRNGLGAFNSSTSARQNLPATGRELENADNDRVFRDMRQDENEATAFDDVVLWMTQDMMMTSMGESCVIP